jgi:transketolase
MYVLDDAPDPELALIATGSEVGVAVEVKKLLAADGWRVRVVSAPCREAFLRLPESAQQRVLGGAERVSIEACRTTIWRSVVGSRGLAIGVDRFGASAPWERLATEYALTGPKIASLIRARFRRS